MELKESMRLKVINPKTLSTWSPQKDETWDLNAPKCEAETSKDSTLGPKKNQQNSGPKSLRTWGPKIYERKGPKSLRYKNQKSYESESQKSFKVKPINNKYEWTN